MDKMKRDWGAPRTEIQRFAPQEYCAVCEWSSQASQGGDHVYGWVLKCERVTSGGVTYGHAHNGCPDERTFDNSAGGPKDGTFIRALVQSGSTQFSINNIATSEGSAWLLDIDGTTGESPDDYWIIGNHAFKVQGSSGVVSYPYSLRYLVNHS